ncbi:hypothetical protein I3760_05G248700 [Carya illinoinensis]|nr:hypothetical protein I3760_05G248700 [Carya illinoinensis]
MFHPRLNVRSSSIPVGHYKDNRRSERSWFERRNARAMVSLRRVGFTAVPIIYDSLRIYSRIYAAPPKTLFFVWTAALGKNLTTDNLRKRRIIITDWCCMCKKDGESVNHLLLHCETARALWCVVFRRVGLNWVMPKSVLELLASWAMPGGNLHVKAMWKMVPICIMWCIWQERNERTFEDKERTTEELCSYLFSTLILWSLAIDFNGLNIHEFLVTTIAT